MPTSAWTFRTRSSVPMTVAVALIAAGFAAGQWYSGGPAAFAAAAPLALAAAFAGWLVFYKPCVRVDDEGVQVVNPLVRYEVPWPALIEVRTRYAATFVTPHRTVQAFAAPGPGRHAAILATSADVRGMNVDARKVPVGLGDIPTSPSGQVATVVRRRWEELSASNRIALGEADTTAVTRSVDVRDAVVLACLVIVGVVALVLV